MTTQEEAKRKVAEAEKALAAAKAELAKSLEFSHGTYVRCTTTKGPGFSGTGFVIGKSAAGNTLVMLEDQALGASRHEGGQSDVLRLSSYYEETRQRCLPMLEMLGVDRGDIKNTLAYEGGFTGRSIERLDIDPLTLSVDDEVEFVRHDKTYNGVVVATARKELSSGKYPVVFYVAGDDRLFYPTAECYTYAGDTLGAVKKREGNIKERNVVGWQDDSDLKVTRLISRGKPAEATKSEAKTEAAAKPEVAEKKADIFTDLKISSLVVVEYGGDSLEGVLIDVESQHIDIATPLTSGQDCPGAGSVAAGRMEKAGLDYKEYKYHTINKTTVKSVTSKTIAYDAVLPGDTVSVSYGGKFVKGILLERDGSTLFVASNLGPGESGEIIPDASDAGRWFAALGLDPTKHKYRVMTDATVLSKTSAPLVDHSTINVGDEVVYRYNGKVNKATFIGRQNASEYFASNTSGGHTLSEVSGFAKHIKQKVVAAGLDPKTTRWGYADGAEILRVNRQLEPKPTAEIGWDQVKLGDTITFERNGVVVEGVLVLTNHGANSSDWIVCKESSPATHSFSGSCDLQCAAERLGAYNVNERHCVETFSSARPKILKHISRQTIPSSECNHGDAVVVLRKNRAYNGVVLKTGLTQPYVVLERQTGDEVTYPATSSIDDVAKALGLEYAKYGVDVPLINAVILQRTAAPIKVDAATTIEWSSIKPGEHVLVEHDGRELDCILVMSNYGGAGTDYVAMRTAQSSSYGTCQWAGGSDFDKHREKLGIGEEYAYYTCFMPSKPKPRVIKRLEALPKKEEAPSIQLGDCQLGDLVTIDLDGKTIEGTFVRSTTSAWLAIKRAGAGPAAPYGDGSPLDVLAKAVGCSHVEYGYYVPDLYRATIVHRTPFKCVEEKECLPGDTLTVLVKGEVVEGTYFKSASGRVALKAKTAKPTTIGSPYSATSETDVAANQLGLAHSEYGYTLAIGLDKVEILKRTPPKYLPTTDLKPGDVLTMLSDTGDVVETTVLDTTFTSAGIYVAHNEANRPVSNNCKRPISSDSYYIQWAKDAGVDQKLSASLVYYNALKILSKKPAATKPTEPEPKEDKPVDMKRDLVPGDIVKFVRNGLEREGVVLNTDYSSFGIWVAEAKSDASYTRGGDSGWDDTNARKWALALGVDMKVNGFTPLYSSTDKVIAKLGKFVPAPKPTAADKPVAAIDTATLQHGDRVRVSYEYGGQTKEFQATIFVVQSTNVKYVVGDEDFGEPVGTVQLLSEQLEAAASLGLTLKNDWANWARVSGSRVKVLEVLPEKVKPVEKKVDVSALQHGDRIRLAYTWAGNTKELKGTIAVAAGSQYVVFDEDFGELVDDPIESEQQNAAMSLGLTIKDHWANASALGHDLLTVLEVLPEKVKPVELPAKPDEQPAPSKETDFAPFAIGLATLVGSMLGSMTKAKPREQEVIRVLPPTDFDPQQASEEEQQQQQAQ